MNGLIIVGGWEEGGEERARMGIGAATRGGMIKLITELNSARGKGLIRWRMGVLIVVGGWEKGG